MTQIQIFFSCEGSSKFHYVRLSVRLFVCSLHFFDMNVFMHTLLPTLEFFSKVWMWHLVSGAKKCEMWHLEFFLNLKIIFFEIEV